MLESFDRFIRAALRTPVPVNHGKAGFTLDATGLTSLISPETAQ